VDDLRAIVIHGIRSALSHCEHRQQMSAAGVDESLLMSAGDIVQLAGVQVIGTHRCREARISGQFQVAQQHGGGELFVGAVEPE
jgi:hypothetical protein